MIFVHFINIKIIVGRCSLFWDVYIREFFIRDLFKCKTFELKKHLDLLLVQVVMCYHGHRHEVRVLLPLGDQLISADSGCDVIVWDVQGGGEWSFTYTFLLLCLVLFPIMLCFLSVRRLPTAAVRPRHLRCDSHDAPEHLPEQGATGKLPGCTAALEHQDQVSILGSRLML